jgi:hypothetical protein
MPLKGTYRPFLDLLALQRKTVPAYIPDPSLGIDHAAEYQPYNLSYYRLSPNTKQTVVVPDPTYFSIEQIAPNFQGNPVKQSDFPQDFFVGNPIGGF